MQPLTAPVTQETEDIEAVLGRFRAWTSAQKKNGLMDGVRELSYEEALESSRRRWQQNTRPSPPKNRTPAPPEPFSHKALEDDKVTLGSATKRPASVPETVEPLPKSFGNVLTETISPEIDTGPLALVWPAPGKTERQVSISCRVAASEQALIKARAAEAGLSVSAYLRQCALEVEKLRSQVHHTLSLIEEARSPVLSLKGGAAAIPPPPAGLFTRLRRFLFGSPDRLTLNA